MSLRTYLRGLRAASVFLTRVPFGGFPYSDAEWRWASAWFPAVGLAHGAACGLVYSNFNPSEQELSEPLRAITERWRIDPEEGPCGSP